MSALPLEVSLSIAQFNLLADRLNRDDAVEQLKQLFLEYKRYQHLSKELLKKALSDRFKEVQE